MKSTLSSWISAKKAEILQTNKDVELGKRDRMRRGRKLVWSMTSSMHSLQDLDCQSISPPPLSPRLLLSRRRKRNSSSFPVCLPDCVFNSTIVSKFAPSAQTADFPSRIHQKVSRPHLWKIEKPFQKAYDDLWRQIYLFNFHIMGKLAKLRNTCQLEYVYMSWGWQISNRVSKSLNYGGCIQASPEYLSPNLSPLSPPPPNCLHSQQLFMLFYPAVQLIIETVHLSLTHTSKLLQLNYKVDLSFLAGATVESVVQC